MACRRGGGAPRPLQIVPTSSTSPAAYSPGTSRDCRVAGSKPRVSMPPAVAWAADKPWVPVTGSVQRFISAATRAASSSVSAPTGVDSEMPAARSSVCPTRLCSNPVSRSPASRAANRRRCCTSVATLSGGRSGSRSSDTLRAPFLRRSQSPASREIAITAGPDSPYSVNNTSPAERAVLPPPVSVTPASTRMPLTALTKVVSVRSWTMVGNRGVRVCPSAVSSA